MPGLAVEGREPTPASRATSSAGALVRFVRANSVLSTFVALQVVLVLVAITMPDRFRYLSATNINVMIRAVPPLAIMATGVGLLMIAGEYDLSVGSNYTLSAVVMASTFNGGLNPFAAAALALLTGTLIGLVNGAVTLRFNIPSFITTLGAMLVWKGGVLFYNGASAEPFKPGPPFATLFADGVSVGAVQLSAGLFWLSLFGIGFALLLDRHRLGNHVFAVGGTAAAAVAIGVRPFRTKMITFAVTGACAAFAGILATSRIHSAQPGQGAGLELQAIAACVIGGVALTGGRGSVLGMVLGTWLVFTIQDVLLLVGAPGFYLDIFVGALIAGAVIVNRAVRGSS